MNLKIKLNKDTPIYESLIKTDSGSYDARHRFLRMGKAGENLGVSTWQAIYDNQRYYYIPKPKEDNEFYVLAVLNNDTVNAVETDEEGETIGKGDSGTGTGTGIGIGGLNLFGEFGNIIALIILIIILILILK